MDRRPGARIKECRESLGLTQEEFAEKVGLSGNQIARIERGESFPRLDNLILILNTLGVSADAIFCDVLEQPSDSYTSSLAKELEGLPMNERLRILQILRFVVHQAKEDFKNPQ